MKKTFLGLSLCLVALMVATTSCRRTAGGGMPADVDYYTCTMHPSVKKQNPNDKCPICGMALVPVKKRPSGGASHNDHTPRSDVPHASDGPTEFTIPVQRQQEIGVRGWGGRGRHHAEEAASHMPCDRAAEPSGGAATGTGGGKFSSLADVRPTTDGRRPRG